MTGIGLLVSWKKKARCWALIWMTPFTFRLAKALELFDRESLMEIDLLYKGSASVTTVSKNPLKD